MDSCLSCFTDVVVFAPLLTMCFSAWRFVTSVLALSLFHTSLFISFGILPSQLSIGVHILHTLLAASGAYHILFITGLKYMATVSQLKHYLVTKSLVLKIVLGVWITSTAFSIIPFVLYDAEVSTRWDVIYTSVCFVAVSLFPYIFMIYAYMDMFSVITKRQRHLWFRIKTHGNRRKTKVTGSVSWFSQPWRSYLPAVGSLILSSCYYSK